MAVGIESTDRYMGVGYPNPETMCQGKCEGLGVYPDMGEPPFELGTDAPEVKFVTCEACGGTGKRP